MTEGGCVPPSANDDGEGAIPAPGEASPPFEDCAPPTQRSVPPVRRDVREADGPVSQRSCARFAIMRRWRAVMCADSGERGVDAHLHRREDGA
eukprot:scaffold27037_cov30-Tisochrysis_lutea.AAC.2